MNRDERRIERIPVGESFGKRKDQQDACISMKIMICFHDEKCTDHHRI